jgi:LAS superfamily LD-carboxypeptidase LdcB
MNNTSNSSKNEVRLALILILVALLSGVLLQFGLQLYADRAASRAGTAIAVSVLDEIQDGFQEIRTVQDDAAERLANLPQRKRDRLDALQLDLLMVVSAESPLPEGYVPELDTVVGDYQLDARCASLCWQMMQDCRESGHGLPMICSAYRTQEFQQFLFDNKVYDVLWEETNDREKARELAATIVALPGTSEHQTGLAADIMDEVYPYLNEWQEHTEAQQWLMEHCSEYGFILRYPDGTSDITGIIYEPWHYRYVGGKFAREITKRGITLEEYVAWRRGR